ncbi:hypothetical protein [Hymenobacter rubidus]|uniref:hypothetical protein n=1 Tax=Hymenobacter rubidus TaxID=1441626 RepID=UPI00191CB7A4|nr:hypothetical protein [Hymenobacter rubidus]
MRFKQIVGPLAVLLASSTFAGAHHRPKALTAAEDEARNETAAPSFAPQVREAGRIAAYLSDALVLSNVQRHAVACYTLAERTALALAATTATATLVRHEYLLAIHSVLTASQHNTYAVLRQQLNGTAFSLDGTELALR